MSNNNSGAGGGGVGFLGLLRLLFIGLKLGAVIEWSWWWVVAPLWVPPLVILAFYVVLAAAFGIVALARYLVCECKS